MGKIFLFVRVGLDGRLLERNLAHYRALGVERILVDLNLPDAGNSDLLEYTREVAKDYGADIADVYYGNPAPSDQRRGSILPEYCTDDDWVVICDLDEFQEYPCDLRELVAYLERRGCDFVQGRLLDRVAGDGTLPPLREGPLWDQFPVGIHLTASKRGGDPRKIVLARPWVQVDDGQHRALSGCGLPEDVFSCTVHHFKWDAAVVERSQWIKRMEIEEGRHWWRELDRLLSYLASNDGRIDLSDPALGARWPGYKRSRPVDAQPGALYFEPYRDLPWMLKPRHFIPVRRPGVILREIGGRPVLSRARDKQGLVMNGPALAIWELCDGTRTCDDIVEHLAEGFHEDAGELKCQVTDVLDLLSAGPGYIEAVPGDPVRASP